MTTGNFDMCVAFLRCGEGGVGFVACGCSMAARGPDDVRMMTLRLRAALADRRGVALKKLHVWQM